jgi:hypothetical protein
VLDDVDGVNGHGFDCMRAEDYSGVSRKASGSRAASVVETVSPVAEG